MPIKTRFLLLILSALLVFSCETIALYEKNAAIPEHRWSKSFKPVFSFDITDTASAYKVFIVFRHNEKYNYNNIWIRLSTRIPGDTAVQTVQYELPLANSEGWISEPAAMDDLYEHRIQITPPNEPVYFRKSGAYQFTIEQIMREDPLPHVMNIGLRIEKQTP